MDANLSFTLKQQILLKTGLKAISSKDCKRIASEIRHSLNRHISVTTIKRVFGFAQTKHHFSRYTIATLEEYASVGDEKSSSLNMDILSFIADDRSCMDELNENEPYLHPEHLVATALNMMLKDKLDSLAICKNGKYIGRIYTDELKHFINGEVKEASLTCHRLNFDLLTAITVMKREGV